MQTHLSLRQMPSTQHPLPGPCNNPWPGSGPLMGALANRSICQFLLRIV